MVEFQFSKRNLTLNGIQARCSTKLGSVNKTYYHKLSARSQSTMQVSLSVRCDTIHIDSQYDKKIPAVPVSNVFMRIAKAR